jgi:hypothetical protein
VPQRRAGLLALTVGALFLAPLTSFVVLSQRLPPSPLESSRPAAPTLVAPTRRTIDELQVVKVTLTWGTPLSLLWPGTQGTITAVDVVIGQPVVSGSRVALVSGRPVIALHTPDPLYRDIVPGLTGLDVQHVGAELVVRRGFGGVVESGSS